MNSENVLENDARRLLAYHIVSQVGYMVCGVGIGTELALNGATAHAFAHILYKALLFMGAGAVLHLGDDQTDPFLAYGVAGRNIKQKKQNLGHLAHRVWGEATTCLREEI